MSKPKFNYILNDLAFSNLRTKCLYTECTEQDIVEFENQLKLKEQELQRKDNIIKDAKEVLLTTNNVEKALNVLDKINELEESK